VSENSGRVLNGHARLELALETGQARVGVTFVDVTEEEEAWILATYDAIGRMAGVDPAKAAIAFGTAFGGSSEDDWRRLIDRGGRM